MKKIMRRMIGIVIAMAIVLSSVIGGNRTFGVPGADRARAAEPAGKYISDIVISYADSKEKAEEELGEEYTVLDVDLNNETAVIPGSAIRRRTVRIWPSETSK